MPGTIAWDAEFHRLRERVLESDVPVLIAGTPSADIEVAKRDAATGRTFVCEAGIESRIEERRALICRNTGIPVEGGSDTGAPWKLFVPDFSMQFSEPWPLYITAAPLVSIWN